MRIQASRSVVCILLITTSAGAQSVWYVDDDGDSENGCTSWADACPELQTALSLATDGDQIWVAEGTYKPDYNAKTGQHTGDRKTTFQLIGGVALFGGFDGTEDNLEDRPGFFDQTILTGDIGTTDEDSDNSYHVVTGSGTDESTILDGFTITAGNADSSPPNDRGGGLFNIAGSPTLTHCTFNGNSANFGGGLANVTNSAPTLRRCMFTDNSANNLGGGMYNLFTGSPTMIDCTFGGNSAVSNGGGMFNNSSSPTLVNCLFAANNATFGAGMYNNNLSTPILINCMFRGNLGATHGGGMRNFNSSPALINSTFSGNSASVSGGAVFNLGDSNPTVTNCVLWGDIPNEIADFGKSATTVSHSDVEGGWFGTGVYNIDADPLFVDAAFGDLRLLPGSPCIDAADNTAVPKGVVMDLDGNPRFVDDPDTDDTGFGKPPIVDMGAYEFRDPCADDDGDGRVTICHLPPGNLNNARTIIVNMRALPAHLAHGDFCGPCEDGDG
ncbi:MAG: right-handed parallel beta-helix repeat-containing protein [Planctomycetota bacterium]|nr:right-handed parallel beta-helix repeat-containing protein [Planctomycetota bacterium]